MVYVEIVTSSYPSQWMRVWLRFSLSPTGANTPPGSTDREVSVFCLMDSHHCQKIRLFFLPVICGCAITTHSHKGNGFSPVSLMIQDNTAVLELSTLLSALRIHCSFTLRILLFKEGRRKRIEKHFPCRSRPEQFLKPQSKKTQNAQ